MVAIYCRVSTDNQTIESQLHAIKKYCEAHSILEYQVYSDEGFSGSLKNRPALDKLMTDVENRIVNCVICFSLSRISRTTTHLLQILERLQSLNVNFISITESISLNTPAGKMMVTVLSAVYELEKSLIRERVMAGLANAKSKGVVLGAKKKRNSALIRELRKQGLSYRKICILTGYSIGTISKEMTACSVDVPA